MNEINRTTGQKKKSNMPARTNSATVPMKKNPKITRLMKKIIANGMPTNKNRNIAPMNRNIAPMPTNKNRNIAPKIRNGENTNRVTTSGIKFQAS